MVLSEQNKALCQRLDDLLPLIHEDRLIVADNSLPPEEDSLNPNRPRLFVFLSGKRTVRFSQGGNVVQHDFTAGDCFYCPTTAWHKNLPSTAYEVGSIVFDPAYTRFHWKKGDELRETWIFFRLFEPLNRGAVYNTLLTLNTIEPSQRHAVCHLVHTLIHLLKDAVLASKNTSSRPFLTYVSIHNYVYSNYHLPLDREFVGRAFGIHPNHVSRLFKEHGEASFSQVLTKRRVEQAAHLLERSDLTVQVVAERCGFESASYFIKVFRRFYGCTPGTVRNGKPRSGSQ